MIHPISVPRSEIKVGQVIWATLVLDVASVPPKALRKKPQSTTVQRIVKGKPCQRMAVVLDVASNQLTVAYLTSFGGSATLVSVGIDEDQIHNWWPIKPAEKEGDLEPIDMMGHQGGLEGCWVSLKNKYFVTSEDVKLLDQRLFWGGYRSRYLLSEDE